MFVLIFTNDIIIIMKIARIKYRNKIIFAKFENNEFIELVGGFNSILRGKIQEKEIIDSNEIVKFLPPCKPTKIIGLARNYESHAMEAQKMRPKQHREPDIFFKATSSLIGHLEKIKIPAFIKKPDYEGELVIIISKKIKEVSSSEAKNCILGYSIGNDITARDIQQEKGMISLAKSLDTFSPVGPWFVTVDEIGDEPNLNLILNLNGNVMQKENTSNMIFNVKEIISYVSKYFTLYPGDIIFTGTPSGVGHFREPPVYLKKGDKLEVTVEKIGTLLNEVE